MKILAERVNDRKVFLYGAGNIGKQLCEFLESQGIKVVCFLDKKENSSSIGALRVVNPFVEAIEKTDSIVIVSIFNRDVDYLSVKEQLLDIGFNEVISFIEFYPYISKTFGDWYWLSSNKDYLQDEEALRSVNDLWSDDLSREIFSAIIAARKLDKYELLPQKYPIEDQYLSSDIPLKNYSKFIDCGAFDGDTLDAMENKGIRYEKIYAFEPDLQNFSKLAAKVKKYHQQAILFPCGVASSTQLLRFDSGVGEGSAISESGNSVVQCIALDDVLININGGGGTLLKM
ncbi:MAG: hypothetical protein LBL79_09770, partial [Prevotella sp.]|nr:hypothetical protein [Prevotella sp.]